MNLQAGSKVEKEIVERQDWRQDGQVSFSDRAALLNPNSLKSPIGPSPDLRSAEVGDSFILETA